MFNKLTSYLAIILLLTACSSQKKLAKQAEENPRPDWVLSKPISSSYYYGIGTVNSAIHPTHYQQIAKSKALEDMASEIEVVIDAHSVLSQKESSQSFIENYQATTRIDVNNNLSDYEAMDSWWNNKEYWVLFRLSKATYKQKEEEKRNQAISKAEHFIELANKEEKEKIQLEYYLQAIEAIKPYLNAPLKSELDGEKIYLGNYLFSTLTQFMNGLKIIPGDKKSKLNWENCFTKELSYSVQMDGQPLASMPIRVKYNSYAGQRITSDEFGISTYKIKAEFYEKLPSDISAWIKTSDLIADPLLASLFEEKYSLLQNEVSLIRPRVFIKTSEGLGTFQNTIEKAGAKYSPTVDESDIYIEANFNTRSGGKNNDFYTSTCTMELSVYNMEGDLIEKKIWPEAKGVHTQKTAADKKALENALKQMKHTWIQALIMEHCKN